MAKTIIAGNWKMHGTKQSVSVLLSDMHNALGHEAYNSEIIIFAPFVFLASLQTELVASSIEFGAQNMSQHEQGAYTGEIAATMLKDFGCEYVLLGHSERRQYFYETDADVAAKFVQAQTHQLTPMLCVGETLAQREAGEATQVVCAQLSAVIEVVGIQAFQNAVIAYEPIWAIGTGKTASPADAQAVHADIRAFLAEHDAQIAEQVSILYGGSVKPNNAAELFAMPDINGALVGGASLEAEQFTAIVRAAQ